MLAILANWIFIFCSTYAIGMGSIKGFTFLSPAHKSNTRPDYPSIYNFLVGLAAIATLANFWSLFLPVNGVFVGVLAAAALSLTLCASRQRWNISVPGSNGLLYLTVLPFLILIALSLSAGATDNIDEAGYYLPLVKWIEQFAVVPGTALLNHRTGFNSSVHMLNAVFGQSWLWKGGLYDLNGLLFIVFNLYFFNAAIDYKLKVHKEKVNAASLFLSCALIFPFSFLVDSMDSDFLSIFGGIFVLSEIIRHLDQNIDDNKMIMLASISTFLITVKTFNIFLLPPLAYLYVKQYGWPLARTKHNLSIYAAGFFISSIVLAPWIARNYYISGYLVFPVYFLDIFDPAWKVPILVARPTYEIIGEFAKLTLIRPDYLYDGVTDPAISEWLPVWVQTTSQTLIGKIILLATPTSLLMLLAYSMKEKLKHRKLSPVFALLCYAVLILVIWFVKFPSIRFVWPWLLLVIIGPLLVYKLKENFRGAVAYGLILLVSASWTRTLLMKVSWRQFIEQPVLPSPVITEIEHTVKIIDGVEVKYSKDAHCHGLPQPCTPYNNALHIGLIGNKIEEGFLVKD